VIIDGPSWAAFDSACLEAQVIVAQARDRRLQTAGRLSNHEKRGKGPPWLNLLGGCCVALRARRLVVNSTRYEGNGADAPSCLKFSDRRLRPLTAASPPINNLATGG